MADPTEEELATELQTQFEAYLAEIKRLIRGAGGAVKHALDSAKINGYTLADLIAIIKGEVQTHEDDTNNPHNETLAQHGGMSSTDYETKAALYFQKDAMPISQVPYLSMVTNGSQVVVQPATIIYQGRKLQVPLLSSGVMAPVNQYLKILVGGAAPNRTTTYLLTVDDSEDIRTIIVASISYANGVWTATPTPCVRIGAARLSSVPHGSAIPVSSGSQALPGSIPAGWIQ